MFKKGFTLAETLITLGIIALLAVIILPTIQKTMPNKNIAMYRKTYNTLLTTISNLINDDTNYPAAQTGIDNNSPAITVQAGFNYETEGSNTFSGTWYNKFCSLFFDQLNVVSGGSTSCPLVANASGAPATNTVNNSSIATTSDGVKWYVYVPTADLQAFDPATYTATDSFPRNASLYKTKIIIDVNNTANSVYNTNCTADTSAATYGLTQCAGVATSCSKNPDQFILGVRYDGKVQVSDTGASDACASAILTNPNTNQGL